ncbi:Hypothetical protein RAK1035_0603 [Roseovarius sp. AK1035]|nr:Hypothetical protein RAK1035_0603 [Roseovarius sp. AK1035]
MGFQAGAPGDWQAPTQQVASDLSQLGITHDRLSRPLASA